MNRKKKENTKRKNKNGLKYMKNLFSLEIKDTGCMKCHVFVHEIGENVSRSIIPSFPRDLRNRYYYTGVVSI